MPIVTIQVIDEVTTEQKKRLITGVTDLLHDVLVKEPERIYVVVQEVPLDNWGAAGYTVSERRAQGFDGKCRCPEH
ncbi:4-oxalocrotonate tautomerase family protein [Streptomyces sp. NPDC050528]|uniref:tautomerase family protein n=1 Tax=unclassified Streptomyces TaxID=2593676 RepID=UPI003795E1C9